MMPNVADLSHEDALKYRSDLVKRELELESEAISVAQERAAESSAKLGVVDGSKTMKREIEKLVEDVARRLTKWEEAHHRGSPPAALKYIKALDVKAVAYIALRTCIEGLGGSGPDDGMPLTTASTRAASRVKEAIDFENFARANKPLMKKMDSQLAASCSNRHRRAVVRAGMRAAEFEGLEWGHKDTLTLGFTLVQCVIEATGLFEIEMVYAGKSSRKNLLSPTDAFHELISRADAMDPILSPFRLPMVIPPKPWDDAYTGGYLDPATPQVSLVRTRRRAIAAILDSADLSDVLHAVNAVQATPWRINNKVLQVFEQLHVEGLVSRLMCSAQKPPFPEKPWGDDQEPSADELRDWKLKAKEAHMAIRKWSSKRLSQHQKLILAKQFEGEEAIYFPHSLDFRGRVYPVAGMGSVNPQGDDGGKALLEFARGKELTEQGVDWLFIHAANCFGIDKVSLDDRLLWANMNLPLILNAAENPLTSAEWHKADKPWQFLAVCFEISAYLRNPEGFVSHLPVSVDGSCSGLQHFGAMMRCEKTAAAVNLKQTGDTPADVYSVVLRRVSELVEESDSPEAREWCTRLSRNIVKQPVMTTPYGVTPRGMVGQIMENSRKLVGKGQMEDFKDIDVAEASLWLAPLVQSAISTEISAAERAMSWLNHVSATLAEENLPLLWVTPVGFPVLQDYRMQNKRDVRVLWAGKRLKLRLSTDTDRISKRRQAQGAAPNFVHSLDAAHLMVTVSNCMDYGMEDFAVVHDSFGCHANDIPLLSAVLREAFVALYSKDILGDLYSQVLSQVPGHVAENISPPPAMGNLDLTCVRDSDFFFA